MSLVLCLRFLFLLAPQVLLAADAPVIVTPPVSLVVTNGDSAVFSVGATGGGPLVYQWYFDGIQPLAMETNTVLTVPSASPINEGGYTVVVADGFGAVTSQVATLTVLVRPAIVDREVGTGTNLSFTAGASRNLVANFRSINGGAAETAFVLNQTLGGQRNDFQGWVGMKLTVGAEPVTVTKLGRYGVAGNGGIHEVKLVLAADGSDVPGGSVEVAVSEDQWGQMVYGTLGGAVTLAANTAYYLVSREFLGGDFFHDVTSTVTGSGVAVVDSGVFSVDSASWTVVGGGGQVYGPVDLVYLDGVSSPGPYFISGTASPVGGGLVFGGGMVADGETVVVGAEPNAGYLFAGWTEGGALASGLPAYASTAALDRDLVANFVTTPVVGAAIAVAVEPPDGGAVSGSGMYGVGEPVVLTATVADGFEFVNWVEVGHPPSRVAIQGASVVFLVEASGTAPLLYQWFRNGLELEGETGAALGIDAVGLSDEGAYFVRVSNAAGVTATQPSTLSVLVPPWIVDPPGKRTVFEGDDHTFAVTAGGSAPLSYQWRREGVDLEGETNSTLVLTGIVGGDAGVYEVVVANGVGVVTSGSAVLTVRGADELRYPAPQGGWVYLLSGEMADPGASAALDGSWDHNNSSDSWFGDGRGEGNGLPGGIGSSGGVLTVEDAVTSGNNSMDNRRFYLTRDLRQDAGVTNAGTLLDDGVTLTFRARLSPPSDDLMELTNAPNGWVNLGGGRGMFGVRQSGGDGMLISFSLNRQVEDTGLTSTYNFGQAGLHMNSLYGDSRSPLVDPGPFGMVNLLPLDPEVYHEFWITIGNNGPDAGTHRVSVYLDGSEVPAVFNVTAGTGVDGPAAEYLALGLSGTAARGAFDVDFFGYRPGVIPPTGFGHEAVFVRQPADRVILDGEAVMFEVEVVGTPQIELQWYRDGVAIPGETNTTYETPAIGLGEDGTEILVVATNPCGSVTSSPPAVVTVLVPPVVAGGLESLTATNGGVAAFEVIVDSAGPVQYQWRFEGLDIAGAAGARLILDPAGVGDAGGYDVVVVNDAGSVTSAVAVLTILLEDFGDAPEPLPTLRVSDGARHLVVPGVFLGAWVDGDMDGEPDFSALADDQTGIDDEDGIWVPEYLYFGAMGTVHVVASTNGILNGWIDFDLDFSWGEPMDQVFTNVVLAAGTNVLAFRVPLDAASAICFARFRFSSVGDLSYGGPAPDGEVEDFIISINAAADLGLLGQALPEPVGVGSNLTYAVTVTNAGPSMATAVTLVEQLPAGVMFVSAASSVGTCTETNGVVTCRLHTIPVGGTVGVTITVVPPGLGSLTNTMAVQASEVDFDVSNNQLTLVSAVLAPPLITVEPGSLVATNGGEAILAVSAVGEPPLSYQWFLGGAWLADRTNATLAIGSVTPADAGSYTVRVSNGVGAVLSEAADLAVLVAPVLVMQPVSRTNLAGTEAVFAAAATGTEPFVCQWYFDGTHAVEGGTNWILVLEGVDGSDAGLYHLRVANGAGVAVSEAARLAVMELDFGDAPDPVFPTLLSSDGARHVIVGGFHLGGGVDFEPDGWQGILGQGDDVDGLDDEDGVELTSVLLAGQAATVEVVVSAAGLLSAWVDWNSDGQWGAGSEQVFTDRLLVPGTNALGMMVPVDAAVSAVFARFRFDSGGGLTPSGLAADGEVEDYRWVVGAAMDLGVELAGEAGPVATGSEVSYQVVVTNRGPSVAAAVVITNSLGADFGYVAASSSQGVWVNDANGLSCELGSMPAGSGAAVTITLLVLNPGVVTNRVVVSGAGAELNPADDMAAVATLVLDVPAVLSGPMSQSVSNGSTASFEAVVAGDLLTFQWRFNGVDLPGETNAVLVVTDVDEADTGSYTLFLSNVVGVALSEAAELRVLLAPQILLGPATEEVVAGTNVQLSVSATGTAPLSYQWKFNGVDLEGETGPTLTLAGAHAGHEGSYRVEVSNPAGTTLSEAAILTVVFPPVLTLQPQSRTVEAGVDVQFDALASGTEPLSYQWYLDGNPLEGPSGATLLLTGVVPADGGGYELVVANPVGAVTSVVAVLVVEAWDFGDAADPSYPTLLIFDGARHQVVPGFHMGSGVDYEDDGQQSFGANGDDLDGSDDEDGIRFPFPLRQGQPGVVDVEVSAAGFIDAWIDFGQTGLWGDPGDELFAGMVVTAGVNRLTFAVPEIAAEGQTVGRFRFSSTGGYSFEGAAADGEVEDHAVQIVPAFDLGVTIQPLPPSVFIGTPVSYSISVTNHELFLATGVTLTDWLPHNVQFSSVSVSQGSCSYSGGVLSCNLGSIVGGGGVLVQLVVNPLDGGNSTNVVRVRADQYDPIPGNDVAQRATTVLARSGPWVNDDPINMTATGAAGLYPSTILVSGVDSIIHEVSVTLSNVSHAFPDDIDVLLAGPGGERMILVSDAGGGSPLTEVTMVFSDSAPLQLSDSGQLFGGSVRPGNFGAAPDPFPAPAPPGPYGSTLSVFSGTNPNGVWSLYVVDDFEDDQGTINDGWSLTLVTLGPLADLGVTQSAAPDPVGVGTNLTYDIEVRNHGPAMATGVVLEDLLPQNVTVLSVVPSQGSCQTSGGTVTCVLGNLGVGASATLELVISPNQLGTLSNRVSVRGNRLDINPENNESAGLTGVEPLTDVSLILAPVPAVISLGDPLTYSFAITNQGLSHANTLLFLDLPPNDATVVSAVPSQGSCSTVGGRVECDLGDLARSAGAGVTIVVTPQRMGLMTNFASVVIAEVDVDEANNTAVSVTAVTEALPAFENGSLITIGGVGAAEPYPSTIEVMGATGTVHSVSVTLSNLTHAFPDELDVLLVGPGGEKLMLMSDAGGGHAVADLVLRFEDGAVSELADEAVILAGAYRPTDHEPGGDLLAAPAPAGPYGTGLSIFGGGNPNGVWSLYLFDDTAGGGGQMMEGWSLDITLGGPVADLAVSQSLTPDPVAVGSNLVYSITVTNPGPTRAYGVTLTGLVPGQVSVAAATHGSCEVLAGSIVCQLGSLAGGEAAGIVLDVVPSVAGVATNRVTVTSISRDFELSDNVSEVTSLVRNPPVILVRPESQVATNGNDVLFSVTVGGDGPLTYQWLRNGSNIAGEVGETLLVPGVTIEEAGAYAVLVRNDVGGVLSGQAVLGILVRPVISVIPDQTVLEDANTGVIPFTVEDLETPAQRILVEVATSNPGLVPPQNIFVTGIYTNRTLVMVPRANDHGTATITLFATDEDDLVSSNSFLLTVTPVNDLPTISNIPNLDASAGVVRSIAFGVGDVEGLLDSLIVTGTSSNPGLVPNSSLSVTGAGTNRILMVDPGMGQSGQTTITLTVRDPDGGEAQDSFVLTVLPNSPPTMSLLTDVVTAEDSMSPAMPVVVGDEESLPHLLVLTGSSSNPALVAEGGILFGGSGSNRTVRVVPSADQFGSSIIEVTATDPGGSSVSRTFLLTVTPVNDAPVVSWILDPVMEVNGVLGLPLTVWDVESPAGDLVVSGVSGQPGLLPGGGIVISGSGGSRTVTLTPAAGQTGVVLVELVVMDPDGGAATNDFLLSVDPVNTAPVILTQPLGFAAMSGGAGVLSVSAAGSAPLGYQWRFMGLSLLGETGESLLLTNLTEADEGIYTVVVTSPFGSDTSASAVVTVSDNGGMGMAEPVLVPRGSVWRFLDNGSSQGTGWRGLAFNDAAWGSGPAVLGYGSGPATTVGFGPDSGNKYITTYFRHLFSVPDPGAYTNLVVDLLRDDGAVVYLNGVELFRSNMPGGPISSGTVAAGVVGGADETAYFRTQLGAQGLVAGVNVLAVEIHQRTPDSSDIAFDLELTGGVAEHGAAAVVSAINGQTTNEDTPIVVPFTITGGLTPEVEWTFLLESSNPNRLPNGNILLEGSGENWRLILVPAPNEFGTAGVTLTLFDGPESVQRSFQLTINPVNDPPSLNPLPAVALIKDVEVPINLSGIGFGVPNETTGSLKLSAVSTDNGRVEIKGRTYSSPDSTGIQKIKGRGGTSVQTVTITIEDDGQAVNRFFSRAFDAYVRDEDRNEAPAITSLAGVTIQEGTSTLPLSVSVADLETAVSLLAMRGLSLNTNLVSDSGIVFGGTGANRTVTVTPLPGRHGVADIQVMVVDGEFGMASRTFRLTVVPVNEPPVISAIPDQVMLEGEMPPVIRLTVGDPETGASGLTVTAASSNPALVPLANIQLGGVGTNRVVVANPAPGEVGSAVITLTVSDGAATANEVFLLVVNEVLDPPVIADIPNQVIAEDGTTGPIEFTVADDETAVKDLVVTAVSSNPALLPPGSMVLSGLTETRTLLVTPVADGFGTAVITVTVTDGNGGTAFDRFILTVTPVNDAPTLDAIGDVAVLLNSGGVEVVVTGIGSGAPNEAQVLGLSAGSGDRALVWDPVVDYLSSDQAGSLRFSPVRDRVGESLITVTVSDGQGLNNPVARTFMFRVQEAVRITGHPEGQLLVTGGTLRLGVIAEGTTPSYQWRRGGVVIPGATGAEYERVGVQPADSGDYDVVVFNEASSVTSRVARVTAGPADFGDAPAGWYPTLLAADGAWHLVGSGVYLGAAVDAESDGLQAGLALGDDLDGLADEDGVLILAPMIAGQAAMLEVVVSTNGFLSGWIDFGGDGSWAEAGDEVLQSRALVTGTNILGIEVPAGAVGGPSFGRFRFGSVAGLPVTGGARDGEVEDYGFLVERAPAIVEGPEDVVVSAGEDAVFAVTTIGSGPLQYQWRRGGEDLPGATSPSLTLAGVALGDSGIYTVVVSNSLGMVESEGAVLTVVIGLRIVEVVKGPVVTVSFTSLVGYDYTLEYKDSFAAPGWTDLGTVSGNGLVRSLEDPDPAAPLRVYRVRAEPVP